MDAETRIQITTILAGLPGAATEPLDWEAAEGFDYMYRAGRILTREQDAGDVIAMLRSVVLEQGETVELLEDRPAFTEDGDGLPQWHVPGIGRLQVTVAESAPGVPRLTVPQILDRVDAALGTGVGRPEHILHSAGHACAATEPTPPGGVAPPVPARAFTGQCGQVGTGENVRVAIVDTGLVPEYAGLPVVNTARGDVDPHYPKQGQLQGIIGHGTTVAACILAMAPDAKVFVHRGLGRIGSGFEEPLAAVVRRALDTNPDLLVITFATECRKELGLLALDVVLEKPRPRSRVTIFAPAGNGNSSTENWPAAYPNVISVGALTKNGKQRASFSNYGPWVKVFAPGQDAVNAYAKGDFTPAWSGQAVPPVTFNGVARWSGTSFSTPLVAGLVAARMSATGETSGAATAALLAEAATRPVDGRPSLTTDLPCGLFTPGGRP